MSNATVAKRKLGFTMIEVLVATVLLGLGITMGFSALSSMTRTELRVRQVEKMNLLAVQKLNEVIAYGNIANQQTDGSFSDFGDPDYKWTMDTTASGVDNVATVRITVQTSNNKTSEPSATASGLIFTSPNAKNGANGG